MDSGNERGVYDFFGLDLLDFLVFEEFDGLGKDPPLELFAGEFIGDDLPDEGVVNEWDLFVIFGLLCGL
jgi:hypothetical protein